MLRRKGTWKYEGSNHLELYLSKRHMGCIHPIKHEIKRVHIIWDAVGYGASLKVASRKLNTIGNMHGHSDVLNGADNLKRMRDDLHLTDAITNIFFGDSEASAAKIDEEEGHLIGRAAAQPSI